MSAPFAACAGLAPQASWCGVRSHAPVWVLVQAIPPLRALQKVKCEHSLSFGNMTPKCN